MEFNRYINCFILAKIIFFFHFAKINISFTKKYYQSLAIIEVIDKKILTKNKKIFKKNISLQPKKLPYSFFKSMTNIFNRNPLADSLLSIQNFTNVQRGYFFYFRTMCLRMQARFVELIDVNEMPQVFLHGNPHIENFAIVKQGAGMVDFDRSRLGPYAWDLVRFLCSLSLKRKKKDDNFLSSRVLQYFLEGYKHGLNSNEKKYKSLADFLNLKKVNWNITTTEYLKKDDKWAKKLRQNPIDLNDNWLNNLLKCYLESRNEIHLLENYEIEEAGHALGSLGNQRALLVLKPKNLESKLDKILLDLKTVYQDNDNDFFKNPVVHHGERMILASDLYAPNLEENMGFFTYQNQQYWGRKVPTIAIKIKGYLSEIRQIDVAYCVGMQLGRGHQLSIKNAETKDISLHLEQNFETLVKIGKQMNDEIMAGHQQYLAQLAQQKNIVTPPKIKEKENIAKKKKGK
ncbi:MAG: DUF2252 domain-containing protein [Bacteroidetes bacterium]|nr:MAG: DUF2252 domain-containing protein [Bacteroidota bacterium]TAG85534.1 MAG: DUF2252 domain-containing protein [Bacteroidota bacterium]